MSFIDVNRTPQSTIGVVNISQNYNVLGVGLTDRIFLLGHGDLPNLNDPYLVTNIDGAVAALKHNANCPLMRAMLEAYYAGAKDIYLVAVAPMSEYIADPSQRNDAWYQNYTNQLQVAYDILVQWDLVQWIVPLEAPFNTSTDFLLPLAKHCLDSLLRTGSLRSGILGTRKGSGLTSSDILAMANDPRIQYPSGSLYTYGSALNTQYDVTYQVNGITYIDNVSDIGLFVSVFVGEGIINLQEMPASYTNSVVPSVVAQLAQLPLNKSVVNLRLPNMVGLIYNPTKADISTGMAAGLNMSILTTIGRRGKPFQVIMSSDNTLAPPGSDFESLNVCRAIQDIVDYIAALARRDLTNVGLVQFQLDVKRFLTGLIDTQQIRGYDLSIDRDTTNIFSLIINLAIQPFGLLRTILFTVNVGPGT